ncbi:MAG: hypothetical protein Q8P41_02355 [Pseudomonadota bacterium]|nr:hypothetical protein [Pseudomonadota bacterium]
MILTILHDVTPEGHRFSVLERAPYRAYCEEIGVKPVAGLSIAFDVASDIGGVSDTLLDVVRNGLIPRAEGVEVRWTHPPGFRASANPADRIIPTSGLGPAKHPRQDVTKATIPGQRRTDQDG